MTDRQRQVDLAAEAMRAWLDGRDPRVGIVLGSGLGGLADDVDDRTSIPYHEIPGFPQAAVTGHAGQLVAGTLEGVEVLLQQGRFHLYEGHSADTVALPVRAFAQLGVDTLIATNAAGGLRPTMQPPFLMLIADHVNLMWNNSLMGAVLGGEERFPDMSSPYDAALREATRSVAREHGIVLDEGVYCGVLGPSYETPAEIRMLQRLGADAVGMSTVPEVIAARARGLRVLGISSITNLGSGLTEARLSHHEVLEASGRISRDLETVVRGVLRTSSG
ncbi:MAG TPA: purine-nucleoside phosphorylase [Gemmatimonadales bacterium]